MPFVFVMHSFTQVRIPGLYVVAGLERVAEELMGRRKWALYQDVLSTSIHLQDERPNYQQQQQVESTDSQSDIQTAEQKNATGASIF